MMDGNTHSRMLNGGPTTSRYNKSIRITGIIQVIVAEHVTLQERDNENKS